jgi:predicted metal-dependent hydrolase
VSSLSDGRVDLARRGVVWLDGVAVPVRLTGAERAAARLVDRSGPDSGPVMPLSFERSAPPRTLQVGGLRRKDALAAIDRWYRREARERIEAVTRAEAERLDLSPGKVTIRDQKTRWGSCSTSGTLSFNWRLVIGPGHALRYVVIHELIHIRHHNHSRAFWAALTEAMPDWKKSADWLRANERLLTAYRPRI